MKRAIYFLLILLIAGLSFQTMNCGTILNSQFQNAISSLTRCIFYGDCENTWWSTGGNSLLLESLGLTEGRDSGITGDWKYEHENSNEYMIMHFRKNHTFSYACFKSGIAQSFESASGSYSIEKNRLSIKFTNGITSHFIYKITKNELTLESDFIEQ